MLIHEKVQLILKDLFVPGPIHHFPRLKELQASPPPPAETAPDHHLGGMLDPFPGELGVKSVCALGPPAAEAPVPKPERKMALIAEHDLLPLLDSPVGMLSGELQPVILHPLVDQGFVSHLSGGQLKLIMADFLDGADTDISKLRDDLLQILGNDGGIPQDLPSS